MDRVTLYASYKQELSPQQSQTLAELLDRRINHEPSAYITGHKEFFGVELKVSPATLIPRPDTEVLVEKAIELANYLMPACNLIADIGTGSGAIAIALALHLPQAKIYATDISAAALDIARSNCEAQGVRDKIVLFQGDLLDPLPEPVQLIVANLPYISDIEMAKLAPGISRFEPRTALYGGADGLTQIGRLLSQAGNKLLSGGIILLEIGYDQGPAAKALGQKYFPSANIDVATDLSGLDRVLTILTPAR